MAFYSYIFSLSSWLFVKFRIIDNGILVHWQYQVSSASQPLFTTIYVFIQLLTIKLMRIALQVNITV